MFCCCNFASLPGNWVNLYLEIMLCPNAIQPYRKASFAKLQIEPPPFKEVLLSGHGALSNIDI